jgi:hypothetical protein
MKVERTMRERRDLVHQGRYRGLLRAVGFRGGRGCGLVGATVRFEEALFFYSFGKFYLFNAMSWNDLLMMDIAAEDLLWESPLQFEDHVSGYQTLECFGNVMTLVVFIFKDGIHMGFKSLAFHPRSPRSCGI